MAVPYPLLFLSLLAAYLAYSAWARLDSRYPIAAALALLIVAALLDAAGDVASANTFAEYVLLLLAGGIVLLLSDHLREARGPEPGANALGPEPAADHPSAQAADERNTPSE